MYAECLNIPIFTDIWNLFLIHLYTKYAKLFKFYLVLFYVFISLVFCINYYVHNKFPNNDYLLYSKEILYHLFHNVIINITDALHTFVALYI